ncbi:MAG: zinc ribbon domain-containing protein [Clostridia bacterium]|nr:zinc ribbon domain-containing protein [Clostridia bacterium]
MSELINNKCKGCGAELKFDPISGELKCTHCEGIVDIPDQVALNTKNNFTSESVASLKLNDATQYQCQRCGKHHTVFDDQDIVNCPSCGSPELDKKIEVSYVPDGLVPFKLNKEKALESFVAWLKTRKFAPNNLRKLAKSKEISAVYLPAYNYDFETTTKYSGTGHNSYRDSNGNTHRTSERFSKVRDDSHINYLSPANPAVNGATLRDMGNFQLNNMVMYRTEYLYGWVGLANTDDLQANAVKTKVELSDEIEKDVRSTLNRKYDSISNFQCDTTFRSIKFNYVYLPVWVNHYKYKNKDYYCYVNGCSGQVTGKAPKSFWKIFFLVLGIAALVAGIVYLTNFA